MFGIGFTELLLIAIIAILFLGPDKLPGALVDMAKFIKSVKRTITDAKSSIEEEMKISDLKDEALSYKKQLNDATDELKSFKNLNFDNEDDTSYDDDISETSPMSHAKQENREPTPKTEGENPASVKIESENKSDVVTFKKPKKDSKKGDA